MVGVPQLGADNTPGTEALVEMVRDTSLGRDRDAVDGGRPPVRDTHAVPR